MKRRTALVTLLVLGAVPWIGSRAQQAPRHRIGVIWSGNETAIFPYRQAFLAGLQDLGYVVGRNVELHERYFEGDESRRGALVDELIALKPGVLVAGVESTARAAKARTSTIPIVFLISVDPVAAGLVQSLARPGGNATGPALAAFGDQFAKRIELLKRIVPRASRFVALQDATEPLVKSTYEPLMRAKTEAAGLRYSAVWLRSRDDLARAFAEIERERPDAMTVGGGGLINILRHEIASEALRLKLPANSVISGFADAGLLFTFGVNLFDVCRYAAKYVDRILKGAKPAEIPVEQYPKYELVINLKTARALGIEIPQVVLLQADRVIE